MAKRPRELSAKDLRLRINPKGFDVDSTANVRPPAHRLVGQERALEAIKLGMGMTDPEYNIYVAGGTDTGATYISRMLLEEAAKEQPPPPGWCYVHNFSEPDKPQALKLRRGGGRELKKAMDSLVENLQTRVPAAFASDDYQYNEQVLRKEFER
jgi:hypothetical protein